jgi:hypothetical protein
MMRTLIRRIAKLRNTVSPHTFLSDLRLLPEWPGKTKAFFGMNHDFIRTCIILKLLQPLAVDEFVETGTHRGRTCFLIAAQTELDIFSCEVNKKYLRVAYWLLKCFGSRVHLSNMDSVRFLNELFGRQRFRRPLFYLDAHWFSRLPLIEELCTILSSIESFLIVIDDFRVPGDPDFGFDRYGKTVLEWELIQQTLVDSGRSVSAYFPAYPSSLEVGDRRGWILIASSDNDKVIKETVPRNLLKAHAVIDQATLADGVALEY